MEAFGDFDLLEMLARGGMAELFKAQHRSSGQTVVIKRLLPELEARPDVVDLFLTEADVGRMLKHENVVQVLDAGESDGRYYIAMEYVDGCDAEHLLSDAWSKSQPIPPRLCLRIGIEALRGLHDAHGLSSAQGRALGLVHRDVSPDNLFITRDGVTKVADFGIAKLASLEGVTSTGLLKGKLTYMSPEQVAGVALDGRADEYCLALVLYEMLSSARPFAPTEGESEIDTLMRVKRGKVESLAKLEPGLPRSVAKAVDRALRGWRWRRFRTCADFADALERAAGDAGLLGSRAELAAYVDERAPARAAAGAA
jgi:eukaryotic-like serine/threonine-protein kinase